MAGIKSIKIPELVHKELKVYVAGIDDETITDVAGYAIMKYLAEMGHKFKFQPKTKKAKKSLL